MLRGLLLFTLLIVSMGTHAQSASAAIERVQARLQQAAEQQLTSLRRLPANTIDYSAVQPQLSQLALPSGLTLSTTLRRQSIDSNGVETLVGRSANAQIRVNKQGDASITTIQTDTTRWKILTLAGESIIYDDAELPHRIPADDVIMPANAADIAAKVTADNTAASDEPLTFDTIILYTQATVDFYEGEDLTLARIADIVDTTNEIYRDSDVPLTMNLHKTFLLDYDPDNEVPSRSVLYSMNAEDSVFGPAYQYALQSGVDYLITMRPYVSGDDNCGIAFAGGFNNSEYSADSVMVSHTSIDCGDYVNAHELGHNMGLAHSLAQGDVGYAFPYARGHGELNDFVTVMAYNSAYQDENGFADKLYKFSSPALTCNESPCGVSHTQEDGADAARALRIRTDKLANIRDLTPLKDSFVSINSPFARVSFNEQSSNCLGSCSQDFDPDTDVTVTAQPLAGFQVESWTDDCAGSSGRQCNIQTSSLHSAQVNVSEVYAEGVSFGEALDSPELRFNTDNSESKWRVDGQQYAVGKHALRSPYLRRYQTYELNTEVVGKGTLTFWVKTSFSENESLGVGVNYGQAEVISGSTDWTQYSIEVNRYSAVNEIRFQFYSSNDDIGGDRRFWIDGISFTADPDANKPVSIRISGQGYVHFESYYNSQCRDRCDYYPPADNGQHRFSIRPEANHSFVGWGGDCRGTDNECVVAANDYRQVFAYFTGAEGKLTSQQIASAVDNSQLYFYDVGNDANWQVTDQGNNGDSLIAYSSTDNSYRRHNVKTLMRGSGTLSFDYKVTESEGSQDELFVSIDGYTEVFRGSGGEWVNYERSLDDGPHSIEWTAQLYGMEDESQRSIAIDNVRWTGDSAPFKGIDVTVAGGRGAIRVDDYGYCRDQCRVSLAEVVEGRLIDIFAEANEEAEFTRWEGACQGQDQQCTLNVDDIEDASTTAIFQNTSYEVTASSSAGGVVSPKTQDVVAGDTAQVNLTPLVGHRIVNASGCNGDLSGSVFTTGPINEACAVMAQFVGINYQVSFDLGQYGQRTGGGELEQQVLWGESAQAPEVSVAEGWHFAGWSQTFEKITADTDISAVYQEVDGNLQVNLSAAENTTLSVEPIQYVAQGSSLSITVTAASGYRVNRTVAGSCPAGEWQQQTYTIPNITQNCNAAFSASSVLESGSLLLILATEGQ